MRRYKFNKEITAGGGTVNINLDSNISVIRLYSSTVTLTSSWTFQATDTPADGDEFDFLLDLDVTPSGNSITIFGATLPVTALTNQCKLEVRYNGTNYITRLTFDYEETEMISGEKLVKSSTPLDRLDTTVLPDSLTQGSIFQGKSGGTTEELSIKGDRKIIVGNATKGNSVPMSGDITITNAGVTSIGANKVTTAKILNSNVTAAKLSTDSVETAKIKDANVTSDKIADSQIKEQHLTSVTTSATIKGVMAVVHMQSADLKPLLDGTTNDLFAVKTGDLILNIELYIQTASGVVALVICGPDAVARTAGADTDGILKAADVNATGVYSAGDVAETYMGDLQKFGAFEVDADGWITITAAADCSSSAVVSGVSMYYLPK